MEFNGPLPIHNSITFIGFWHQEAGLVNVDLLEPVKWSQKTRHMT